MREIRAIEKRDLHIVANLHVAAFQGFFLAKLGAEFLAIFYQAVLLEKKSIALLLEVDQKIQGFVVGTCQPNGFYGRILRRDWFRFALAALIAVIKKPKIALSIIQRFFTAHGMDLADQDALLIAIAIDPAVQGQGIGRDLVMGFLEEAENLGMAAVKLVTDRYDNDGVNQFYQNIGFEVLNFYAADQERQMNMYTKKIR